MAICAKARQIGFSHTTAGVAVRWGVYHGDLTTIISKSQDDSDEVLKKCHQHVRLLQRYGSTAARTTRSNTSEICFRNGGRIVSLPASGGRGFSGNVFLDEFAYQEHASDVWENAAPVTQLNHKLRVSSTPNGIGNEFHQLWERAHAPGTLWVPYEVPLTVAKAEGFPCNMAKLWELAKGDPRIFAQLYDCSFLDSEFQYIPGDAIEQACQSYAVSTLGEGDYYAGLDIGREVDRTVLVVIKMVKKVRYVVHVEAIKRTDWDGMQAMVARAFAKFKLKRLCIDANGMGAFPAAEIKKKHSERIDVAHRRPRVECLDFTMQDKENLATGLYGAVSSKSVRLSANDQTLVPGMWPLAETGGVVCRFNEPGTSALMKKELASIRRNITKAGNVTYDAPRTSDGHADHAWALALALFAGSTPNAMLQALSA